MSNRKATKRALLTSVMALALCVVMLVGTTFAWFTDTAKTSVNRIQAGNLKMQVTYMNSTTMTEVGGEKVMQPRELTEDSNVFMEGALWEPGHVEYAVLNVKNVGNLALKYKLGINIASEVGSTNVLGNAFKLSDYIKFGVVEEDLSGKTREQMVAAVTESKLVKEGYTSTETALNENGDNETVTLVVWMPSSVGNDANHATTVTAPVIMLGINVVATQKDYESDSTGPDYDAGAEYPVADNAALSDALENIGAGGTLTIAPGEYAVPNTMPADGVTFSGAGKDKTILKPEEKNYTTTNATFKDMTIDGRGKSSFDNNGVIKLDGNNAVLDNVEVIGGGMNTYGHSVRAGANTTIKNSYIHGAFRAIMAYEVQDTLLVENCVLAPQCYTINIDGGNGKLVVNNSTLKGWTSYTSTIESAAFTGCTFEKNTESGSYGYNYLCPHTDTTLKGCAFGEEFQIGAGTTGFTIAIDDCTFNGAAVTVDNVKTMLDIDNTLKGCTIIVNGVTVTW